MFHKTLNLIDCFYWSWLVMIERSPSPVNAACTAPNAERPIMCYSTSVTAQHSTAQHNTVTIMHLFACLIALHCAALLSRMRALVGCLNEHLFNCHMLLFKLLSTVTNFAAIQKWICAESRFCLFLDPLQHMSTLCFTRYWKIVSGPACLLMLVQVDMFGNVAEEYAEKLKLNTYVEVTWLLGRLSARWSWATCRGAEQGETILSLWWCRWTFCEMKLSSMRRS